LEVTPVEREYIPTAEDTFDKTLLEEKNIVETSTFHGKEEFDYLGRSYLYPPTDVGVELRGEIGRKENFIPKQLIHTWSGHTKVPITNFRV
jgi:pre-mRNA-processing factor 17